jgi:hypothetical protein
LFLLLAGWAASLAAAHEPHSHRGATYEVTAPVELDAGQKRLLLAISDSETQSLAPARFSLLVQFDTLVIGKIIDTPFSGHW